MRDYVNEVLEQMKDKYIAEAADFQAEKRSIRPRVVAVALIAACLMGVTATAAAVVIRQGWTAELEEPQTWEEFVEEKPFMADTENPPAYMYSHKVQFDAQPETTFSEEQKTVLEENYNETLTFDSLAALEEELGFRLLRLENTEESEAATAEIDGRRSQGEYQIHSEYQVHRAEDKLKVNVTAVTDTNGVSTRTAVYYARPIQTMEYVIQSLDVNAKLVSPDNKEGDAASVVWAYFVYEDTAYSMQIVDQDIPAEKFAEACALLETLHP